MVERQYRYRPGWGLVIVGVILFVGLALLCQWMKTFEPPDDWWLLNVCTGFFGVLAVLSLLLGIRRTTLKQHITLSETSIILPTSTWSAEHIEIPFTEIDNLTVQKSSAGSDDTFSMRRVLLIRRSDGAVFDIRSVLLPSLESFVEICETLMSATTPDAD